MIKIKLSYLIQIDYLSSLNTLSIIFGSCNLKFIFGLSQQQQMTTTIKPEEERFPFCIVWTTIPCLSWLLPWIGHVGIGNSEGTVYDFLGKYINVGKMSFNNVKKYVVLENIDKQEYDKAILEANSKYCRLDHDLCCNNCHHHVADALNIMKFQGKEDWSQVSIWWMCLWRSKYVTYLDILCIYLPIVIVLGLIFGLVFGLA